MRGLLPLLGGLLLCTTVHAGDWRPSTSHQSPSQNPDPIVPEVQTDDFSCGFHALSAIYKAHGLDPNLARLRDRLGTSVPAIPFVTDSTGTLQPDLLRVIVQDGFFATKTDPSDPRDRDWLTRHLDQGLYALALIKTDRSGGLHWIVFAGHKDGQIAIADSLKPEPHWAPLDDLVVGPLLSVIVLQPAQPSPGSPYHMLHAEGLLQMTGTFWSAAPPRIKLLLLLILALTAWISFKILRFAARTLRRRHSAPVS